MKTLALLDLGCNRSLDHLKDLEMSAANSRFPGKSPSGIVVNGAANVSQRQAVRPSPCATSDEARAECL